jgi:hypothetical protein
MIKTFVDFEGSVFAAGRADGSVMVMVMVVEKLVLQQAFLLVLFVPS